MAEGMPQRDGIGHVPHQKQHGHPAHRRRAGASFAKNPIYFDGENIVKLAIEGGCNAVATTFGVVAVLAIAIVGYVICLVQLARLRTTRQSFYTRLAVGFACFVPQLECFWRIFGAFAIVLWLILAFWIALFLALALL